MRFLAQTGIPPNQVQGRLSFESAIAIYDSRFALIQKFS
jgi:hypothetical protein